MEVYRQICAMEPLLPKGQSVRLSELTCEILKASGRLTGQVHSPLVLQRVADLVREMNCYYSNLIEGHKTIPRDIERAMKRDFAHDQTQRDSQQLSLAHIAVEKLMEERLAGESVDVYSPDFLCWLHREFYTRLPEPLHWATTQSGQRYQIQPGGLRDFMVEVGKHTPPDFAALPKFLDRFQSFYGDPGRRGDLDGRGNLSDAALADFCVFFLETMLDQIQFMSGLLGLPALRTRVERYFQFQALHLERYREEIMRVTRTLVDEGEIPRARVQEITGKAATVSVEIIKLGLEQGYFETPSPKGPLRVAFPAKIHEFYFPQLFLDLPVEPAGRAA